MNSDRIEGAARDAGGRIQQTVGLLTGNGQVRAGGLGREVGGKGQNLYGQAKDGLCEAVDAVSDYAEDAYDRGSRYVQQSTRTVESQINQNPLMGMVLAGAVGLAIGLVVSQRR